MSRTLLFSDVFTHANAGGDADYFLIQPADDYPVRLKRIVLSQVGEVAEAAEEDLEFALRRLGSAVTPGTGGAAITARAAKSGGSVTGAPTVRRGDQTTNASTSGTSELLETFGWNIRNTPLELRWDDEDDQYDAREGSALLLYSATTPVDDIAVKLSIVVAID